MRRATYGAGSVSWFPRKVIGLIQSAPQPGVYPDRGCTPERPGHPPRRGRRGMPPAPGTFIEVLMSAPCSLRVCLPTTPMPRWCGRLPRPGRGCVPAHAVPLARDFVRPARPGVCRRPRGRRSGQSGCPARPGVYPCLLRDRPHRLVRPARRGCACLARLPRDRLADRPARLGVYRARRPGPGPTGCPPRSAGGAPRQSPPNLTAGRSAPRGRGCARVRIYLQRRCWVRPARPGVRPSGRRHGHRPKCPPLATGRCRGMSPGRRCCGCPSPRGRGSACLCTHDGSASRWGVPGWIP